MDYERRAFYEENGYVVVRGLLSPERDLGPVIAEYSEAVDQLAGGYLAAGAVDEFPREADVTERMLSLMRQTDGRCFQALDITLPVEDQIRPDSPMHTGASVFQFLRNEKLLDVLEDFLGPEILSNPVQHMRIKPPQRNISDRNDAHTLTLTGQTYWHQDLAVVTDDADGTDLVGVWVPLNAATEENGCLLVAPGSHRLGLVPHCDTTTRTGIPEEYVGRGRTPLPAEPGDVILLHPLIQHASLMNTSAGGRWSFDLRYSRAGQPTGRRWFPEFVARSRSDPASELHDPAEWATRWDRARQALGDQPRPPFQRWDPNDPLCA